MKVLLAVALAVVPLVTGGCALSAAGSAPSQLASAACPSSIRAIHERAGKDIAAFGQAHCAGTLASLSPQYGAVESLQFGNNGQAISNHGCLVRGNAAKPVLVSGTESCFVVVQKQPGPIFAAMQPDGIHGDINDRAKPLYFIEAEPGNNYFWVYAPKGSVYGGSDCLVRIKAKSGGVEVAYLPRADGTWELWKHGLTVSTELLSRYAKDFRAFLAPHRNTN